jgi:hypothetical protein
MNQDPGRTSIQMGQWICIWKAKFFVQENKEMLCFDKLQFFTRDWLGALPGVLRRMLFKFFVKPFNLLKSVNLNKVQK